MTAANLSPSPAAARKDLQHDDPIQRLKTMSRSGLTARQTPKTDLTSPLQVVEKAAFPSALPVIQTQNPARQTERLLEDTESMGEAHTLARQLSNNSDDSTTSRRPSTPRSQTDPSPETPSTYHAQPRNRSPYSRSHLRSQSGSNVPTAPPMTRAHSLPTVMHPTGHLSLSPSPTPLARPSSPLRSPKRTRSPRALEPRPLTAGPQERYGSGIRPASIGSFEGAPSVCDISEDAELELTPRAGAGVSSLYSSTGSLSRRRRPASPLHQVSVPFGAPPTSTPTVSTPTSAASSPLLAPAKFNETYPASLASSSVPSTPTSMRSRSPSISSLETIEDSPDAEEEAIEEYRIARLRAAADREDGGDQRRSSLDVPEGRGRSLGFGKRDSRKRWSVCGAERRGDLDLETIWED
ncbi:Nn.00g002940.m01.CDS01 [Neocucurbitaria sp. VM-36]